MNKKMASARRLASKPQTVILKEAVVFIATGAVHPGPKPGGLYGAFIDQNVNASRILIVESALDPCNPSRGRKAGKSERDSVRVLAIPVWVKQASI